MSNKTKRKRGVRPLFEGAEWNFDLVKRAFEACEEIGVGEMGLNVYANQIEVITAEQMLDAYASIGLPHMYRHWSFGKHFAREEQAYRRGQRVLAYELVINSDPCISYIMEENSMTMQTLVIAHAAFGHNHFFKNNYLFRQWTDAASILDYIAFAKDYVTECEEKHGVEAVESVLDSAHALMGQGVSRHPGKRRQKAMKLEAEKMRRRRLHEEQTYNELWKTLPRVPQPAEAPKEGAEDHEREKQTLGLPEENILYFLEKHSPKLEDWKREILRIVRMMSQYFYPQRQTKMMNEGCATFVHYEIMNRLYDKGLLTEGSMLEFLHSHSSVVMQPAWDDRRYSGINPYALGFAMMRDLERMAEAPTDEDRVWFPEIAGCGDPVGLLKRVWSEYRDDSFVLQFLSPKVMRDFRLFEVRDRAGAPLVTVRSIHDERGYRQVRQSLSQQYCLSAQDPDLQITDADLSGSRRLLVTHRVRHGVVLDKPSCDRTLAYLTRLWGYRVKLVEVDAETGKALKEHEGLPMP
jgi:spore cortex formation protein SpoVR/YcgB (stage V sporulation)